MASRWPTGYQRRPIPQDALVTIDMVGLIGRDGRLNGRPDPFTATLDTSGITMRFGARQTPDPIAHPTAMAERLVTVTLPDATCTLTALKARSGASWQWTYQCPQCLAHVRVLHTLPQHPALACRTCLDVDRFGRIPWWPIRGKVMRAAYPWRVA